MFCVAKAADADRSLLKACLMLISSAGALRDSSGSSADAASTARNDEGKHNTTNLLGPPIHHSCKPMQGPSGCQSVVLHYVVAPLSAVSSSGCGDDNSWDRHDLISRRSRSLRQPHQLSSHPIVSMARNQMSQSGYPEISCADCIPCSFY